MSYSAKSRVAMIGLGHMGHALAEALTAADIPLTVWDRTGAKELDLEGMGAKAAASVLAAAREVEVLVVCLLDHAATREAVMTAEVGRALSGKTLVQLTTTQAQEVEESARWAAEYDIDFLKGAILVYPDAIRAGHGEVLYGGSRDLFDRLRPLLDAMGGRPRLVSDRPADVIAPTDAYYAYLYASLFGFLFGASICHRHGVSVESFAQNVIEPLVTRGTLRSFLDNTGRAAAKRRYDEDVKATIDVWNEGFRDRMADLEASEIDTAILQPFKALLDQTAAAGYGQKDIAAVFETLIAKNQ